MAKKRRIFISADIEGISGVSGKHLTSAKSHAWELGKSYMVEDVNAAIRGARAAAPGSEIMVRDAHGGSDNIVLDKLEPGVRLISGWPPNSNMLEGLDKSFDACFFIGYHSRALVPGGVLSHTYDREVRRALLNGVDVGETGINAFLAGGWGVPVVLATGDDKLKGEIRRLLPKTRVAVVKRGISRECCEMLPLAESRGLIEETAREAVLHLGEVPPLRPRNPVDFRVYLGFTDGLRCLECLSDFRTKLSNGILEVRILGRTPFEIYDRFMALLKLESASREG
ncbi:MAG: M55 family metallopeptidase [Elusimicrobiota bacterium]